MPTRTTLVALGLTLAAIGCGPAPTTNSDGGDVATNHDVTPTDTGGSHDAAQDGPATTGCGASPAVTGTCAAPVDLATRGMTSMGATTITGNNCMAPMAAMTDLVAPSCATATMGTMMTNHSGYVVVFDYTMHATADLIASTETGSDPNLDTIVWMADGCGATANELACNDDVDFANGDAHSIALTHRTIPAGTHVKIMVGAFTPAANAHDIMGSFTLTVTENTALVAAGGTCDGMHPFCADGNSCVLSGATATSGTCNPDGTEGADCLTTGTACTGNSTAGTPLGCTVAMPHGATLGACLGVNPDAAACTSDDPLCVTGDTCVPDSGSMTMGHCKRDGASGGVCRTTTPACDTGTCDMTTNLCP